MHASRAMLLQDASPLVSRLPPQPPDTPAAPPGQALAGPLPLPPCHPAQRHRRRCHPSPQRRLRLLPAWRALPCQSCRWEPPRLQATDLYLRQIRHYTSSAHTLCAVHERVQKYVFLQHALTGPLSSTVPDVCRFPPCVLHTAQQLGAWEGGCRPTQRTEPLAVGFVVDLGVLHLRRHWQPALLRVLRLGAHPPGLRKHNLRAHSSPARHPCAVSCSVACVRSIWPLVTTSIVQWLCCKLPALRQ